MKPVPIREHSVMAQEVTVDKNRFNFSSVKIYLDECLGTGAYGAVCKAMCDELPCVAKVLHSALFQFNDPGMPAIMRRFQQECEMMGRIRHPCIVQYLGTVQDPESHRPILLMELMDESLTKFLKRSTAPLAYHLQVNLSYDVALALAYLHSNRVVHRDLSSNNVLITAGSRAKVTDFGMLKLLEQSMRMTPLTKCPGTAAYMPPEALSDEPEYTDKLDCFSFGVLMIQIITRNFPEPTKAMVTVCDPKYPTGRVLVPVPEVERRKSDIDCIETQNCLKPITLDCLKDSEKDRPSAKDICQQLVELKNRDQYHKSLHTKSHVHSTTETLEEVEKLREECAEVRRHSNEKDKVIEDLRQQLRELRELDKKKDGEIEDLKQQLCVQHQDREDLSQIPMWKLKWDDELPVSARRAMWRGAATSVGAMAFFNPGLTGIVYIYDSTTKDWSELPHCLHCGFTLVAIDNMVTAVGGNKELYTAGSALLSFSKGNWKEIYPPMLTKRYFPAATCTNDYLVVAGGCDQGQALATVEIMEINTLQWSTTASLPVCASSASMSACGDSIYLLLGDDTNRVHWCSLKSLLQFSKEQILNLGQPSTLWNRISDLPVSRSTATTLCGQLVSVGGYDDNGEADAVYWYDSTMNKWREAGRLLSCKGLPLATTLPGDKLIVVHGNHASTIIGTATATQCD